EEEPTRHEPTNQSEAMSEPTSLPVAVSAHWLRAHRDRVIVVDTRWYLDGRSGHKAYLGGHLPGAVFADVDTDLSAPASQEGGRHPLPSPETFAASLGRSGSATTPRWWPTTTPPVRSPPGWCGCYVRSVAPPRSSMVGSSPGVVSWRRARSSPSPCTAPRCPGPRAGSPSPKPYGPSPVIRTICSWTRVRTAVTPGRNRPPWMLAPVTYRGHAAPHGRTTSTRTAIWRPRRSSGPGSPLSVPTPRSPRPPTAGPG